MDGLKILDTIRKINPWFRTHQVPSNLLEKFKRREFSELLSGLENTEMATLIIGGRRVGKSVLMYQLIDYLLTLGIEGKKVLFVQGDNPILNEFIKDGNLLVTIFEIYQKYILESSFDEIQDRIYIFIDEAQNLPAWEDGVKALIDLKYNIKFIITGSSSRELRRGAQNPLTGRITINIITPFSFSDFSRYGISDSKNQESYYQEISSLASEFKDGLLNGDLNKTYSAAKKVENIVSQYNLKRKFDDYLVIGGFPWVISHKKIGDDIPKYLRDLLTTTISKDILTQVEVRETQALERLMVNLALSSGHLIKYKTLAETLGIDERIVSKYIDYYVESHWAFISSPYMFHRKIDSIKSEKKVYVIDSGVMNTLTFKDESDLKTDRQYRGQVLENIIHNHLLSFKQNITGSFQNFIPFWIDSENQKEIDFIYEIKSGGVIPIEVKCKPVVDEKEFEIVEKFVKDKQSARFGIITSENILKIKNEVLIIPYSSLALLL